MIFMKQKLLYNKEMRNIIRMNALLRQKYLCFVHCYIPNAPDKYLLNESEMPKKVQQKAKNELIKTAPP